MRVLGALLRCCLLTCEADCHWVQELSHSPRVSVDFALQGVPTLVQKLFIKVEGGKAL